MNNVILTDVDGVMLNWEYAFDIWMQKNKGYPKPLPGQPTYDISKRYCILPGKGKELIRQFNESAAIGFLPPLRDAVHYIRKLHEEQGYVFHVITSLSTDRSAGELRTMNLKKLFGETAIERFVYLDTGADKDEILEQYRDTECMWVEDKMENAVAGLRFGLNSILMEHGYNMQDSPSPTGWVRAGVHAHFIPRVKGWKEIYEMVA